MRNVLRLARLAILAAAVALAAACGSAAAPSPTPAGAIGVELKEWAVTLSRTELAAGKTTFAVKNVGSSAHDLTIVKSDLPEGGLPQESGKAREDGKVAAIPAINPGQSMQLTADLTPGNYIFICNEPGHYALGMHVHVTVK